MVDVEAYFMSMKSWLTDKKTQIIFHSSCKIKTWLKSYNMENTDGENKCNAISRHYRVSKRGGSTSYNHAVSGSYLTTK